ncbi:hypothetical protein F4776DRAFT_19054 [Hypoxylon sp. NC0597]|nr:hypothetical protein F4776DRAFT_19054 [Hypoxylon sp. NC0597]
MGAVESALCCRTMALTLALPICRLESPQKVILLFQSLRQWGKRVGLIRSTSVPRLAVPVSWSLFQVVGWLEFVSGGGDLPVERRETELRRGLRFAVIIGRLPWSRTHLGR